MNKYELMKLSERADCEGFDIADFELSELLDELSENDALTFREKYKEFYTDIKLSHKEDW